MHHHHHGGNCGHHGGHHAHGPEGRFMQLMAMGRRGGWRFGGPGGFGGPGFGGDFGEMRIGRMLASGDLRLVALYFIEQQPRHGYDLIKAIEDHTRGVYVPSPGVVYPALTYLDEAGFVTSTAEGNKRLYAITDNGRAHLAENRAAVQGTLDHLARIGEQMHRVRERWEDVNRGRGEPDRDLDDVAPEFNEARRALKHAIREALRRGDGATEAKVAEILKRAAAEIRQAAGNGERDIDI